MKFKPNDPPRTFETAAAYADQISDCARIELAADEQVTFTTPSGRRIRRHAQELGVLRDALAQRPAENVWLAGGAGA